ncbi:MFS transporter [Salisaeta longa]|uniref:MFS transporter n=1 Tax=Salisaeta longa TaxID=503170 RepID=UPI0003B36922|nr:MFS transporter [Salisaeta longa]
MKSAAALLRDRRLLLLFAVTTVAVGNVSSITPAFPAMMQALGISEVVAGWLVTAYALPGIASAPLVGVWADRWGRKRALVAALVVFAVAGSACAVARSFPLLVALRAVQGAAAAPLVALSITIIGDRYDGARRTTAIGYNATALSISTAAYPALGGALAALAWYLPFALPVLALPVAAGVAWGLDPHPPTQHKTLQTYGRVVREGLARPRVLHVLIVSAGVFTLLFGAYLTYLPVLMSRHLAASSVLSGGVLALTSVASAAMATQLGRLQAHGALARWLVAALGCNALAFALLATAAGWAGVVSGAVLFGVGQGINQPALQNLLVDAAPAESRAVTLALNSTALRIGETIGPLLMGGLLQWGGAPAVFGAAALGAGLLAGLVQFLIVS